MTIASRESSTISRHVPDRAFEAKDVVPSIDPGYDIGMALAGRRQSFILAMAALLLSATVLSEGVTIGIQLSRSRYIPVPVSTTVAGTIALAGENILLADSVLYKPGQVAEFAKRFIEVRYGYDWRAGRAKVLSSITMMEDQYDQTMWPDPATLQRFDQQQMRTTFVFDSTRIEYLRRGIVHVTLMGRQHVNNLQYPDPRNPRDLPFRQVLTVHRVAEQPPFIWGLAVRGSDGDLR